LPRLIPDMLTDGDFPVEFGRYTLLGVLGEGAMARVYRAELRGPGGFKKPTAVKIVRGSVAGRGAALPDALLNEARLGGLLDHPNLVQTLDYGVVDGLPFIAMGYVRGIGLDRLLASDLEIPPEVALEIAMQVAGGLDHAHNLEGAEQTSELVHRDLKPSNIILDRHGLVRVLDFGIAKAAALSVDTTAVGATKGTPAYMSPEQANGEEVDRRSDIFSLGVLMFELITRERLFASTSPLATLQAVLRVEDVICDEGFEARLDAVVPGLGAVVSRCLREAPRLRWENCGAVQSALREVADGYTPAPLLREWVRETQDALGLGHHDPAGLSIDAPGLGRDVVGFDPHGRPRALSDVDEDDVDTDAPLPALSQAQIARHAAATLVPETRRMPAAKAPTSPGRGRTVGLILVALGGTLLAAMMWTMVRDVGTEPTAATDLGEVEAAAAPPDPRGLSEPLEEVVQDATPAPRRSTSRRAPTRPRSRDAVATKKAAVAVDDPNPKNEGPPPLEVSLQQADRTGGQARVMVTARLDASDAADLVVHFKPPVGPWQRAKLKSMGPGGWFRMLELSMPRGATLRWYVTAEFEHGGRKARTRYGTKAAPKRFVLPRS